MVVPLGEAVEVGFEFEVLEVERFAEQETAVPPLLPEHAHDQGPEPLTAEATPVAQRLVVGTTVRLALLEVPQEPLTSVVVVLAEHRAVAPPLLPLQVQYQGPVPWTLDEEPLAQRLSAGAAESAAPEELPQTPSMLLTWAGVLEQAGVLPGSGLVVVTQLLPVQYHHWQEAFSW
jgi:hypothetical protein